MKKPHELLIVKIIVEGVFKDGMAVNETLKITADFINDGERAREMVMKRIEKMVESIRTHKPSGETK